MLYEILSKERKRINAKRNLQNNSNTKNGKESNNKTQRIERKQKYKLKKNPPNHPAQARNNATMRGLMKVILLKEIIASFVSFMTIRLLTA